MELTLANYHSPEANKLYTSSHDIGGYLQCPAQQYAMNQGRWTEKKEAYLGGGYIDCALLTPQDLPQWLADNREDLIEFGFLGKGRKKDQSDRGVSLGKMKDLQDIVQRALADEYFMSYLEGEHQQIITFDLFGVPCKCAFDVNGLRFGRIVDLKKHGRAFSHIQKFYTSTILDILAARSEGESVKVQWEYGPFYNQYNYWRQMAIYSMATKAEFDYDPEIYIAATGTTFNENTQDYARRIYCMRGPYAKMGAESRIEAELDLIKKALPRIVRWRSGEEEAPRCESEITACAFCEATRGREWDEGNRRYVLVGDPKPYGANPGTHDYYIDAETARIAAETES